MISVPLAVILVYQAGVSGGFYLDDYPNLSALSQVSVSGNIWHVILQDASSTLGRPLAMLTFALQSSHWPDDPAAFKWVNILLHALNALLVSFICQRWFIQSSVLPGRYAGWIPWFALLVALLWALAPVQVSSVLYVIQRMNLLAATFTLIGVLSYLWLRNQVAANGGWAGFTVGTLAYCLSLGMGVLAKENAILLPLYLLIMDRLLLTKLEKPAIRWRIWRFSLLWLPLFLLVAYLAGPGNGLAGYEDRPWSLSERLWTQSRVLVDYLIAILWPVSGDFGLYHDGYTISRHWFAPPTTLAAASLLLLLGMLGWGWRRRQPIVAFGIFWFFAGHLLESSLLPLEIKFDHRNYLPSLGLLWALVAGLVQVIEWRRRLAKSRKASSSTRAISRRRWPVLHNWERRACLAMCCLGYVAYILGVTIAEVRLWGQPLLMAENKLIAFPRSLRAHYSASTWFGRMGDLETASWILHQARETYPHQAGVMARLAYLDCFQSANVESGTPDNQSAFAGPTGQDLAWVDIASRDKEAIYPLEQLIALQGQGGCPGVPSVVSSAIIDGLLNNPDFRPDYAQLHLLRGRLNFSKGRIEDALKDLDHSLELHPRLDLMLLKSWWALEGQRPETARDVYGQALAWSAGDLRARMRHQSLMRQVQERITLSGGQTP